MTLHDQLLAKLDGVKNTGQDRWIAKCPAHDDRHPSLSIRCLDDGRMLLHDFGGCGVEDVLRAVGMTFDDLYPERSVDHHPKGERRPISAADVLRCVAFEALVVAVAASRLGNGNQIDTEDRARLLLAASRIQAAVKESGHE
jgi:hypothetical protein